MNGKQLTWQAVAVLAVLGAVAVALAALTSLSAEQVIALLAVLAGVAAGQAVGGAVAGGVQQRVEQIHSETQSQTSTLDAVARRVNGELDDRIAAAMEEAAETGAARAVAALRQGDMAQTQWFSPPDHPGRGLPNAGEHR